MMGWVRAHRRPEIVGLGIDYNEVDHPPERFAEAYAAARNAGLRTTAHAGEFGMPWANIRTAVEELKVDRIDHGYTIVDAPAYARRLAESGIVFTVVPTNSYYLRTLPPERWALDHPIRRMQELGLRLHPNTDDPAFHLVTPSGAWRRMVDDFGFSIDQLRGCMLNGMDAAWIDESTRRAWRVEFEAGFDRAQALSSRP
jgi:adenosine deaminase